MDEHSLSYSLTNSMEDNVFGLYNVPLMFKLPRVMLLSTINGYRLDYEYYACRVMNLVPGARSYKQNDKSHIQLFILCFNFAYLLIRINFRAF